MFTKTNKTVTLIEQFKEEEEEEEEEDKLKRVIH